MKYAWIKAQHHQHTFNVNAMCEMLGVMRSRYCAWIKKPQSARDKEKEDVRLGGLIKKSFDEGRHTCGRKRIQDDLKDWGENVSKRRIGKLMSKLGLWCKTRKKFKATTHSKHNEKISPNLYLKPTSPIAFGSAISRMFGLGWFCLATVIDLYSRIVWAGRCRTICGHHWPMML